MINLDDIISEMLSIEKPAPIKKPTIMERVHNFAKRKEIEKQIDDERKASVEQIIKLGSEAEAFLKSSWYRDLIEPQLTIAVKSGIQTIIRDGESMTETQIKSQIAVVKKCIGILASIKLKIYQAEEAKRAV